MSIPVVDSVYHEGRWSEAEQNVALKAARCALLYRGIREGEMSLVFSSDRYVSLLNSRWRGQETSTNVLSFPCASPPFYEGSLLGDVVLAEETVRREAHEGALSVLDHISHLVIHGVLHLLGFDHHTTHETRVMEGLEVYLLKTLSVSNPYLNKELAH